MQCKPQSCYESQSRQLKNEGENSISTRITLRAERSPLRASTHGLRHWLCLSNKWFLRAATVRQHRHESEVVSDKGSKFVNSNLQHEILQMVFKQHKEMPYHLILMALAEYSSSCSLFTYHMKLAMSILTLLKLSNISKLLCSSNTLPHKILHSPGFRGSLFLKYCPRLWRIGVRICYMFTGRS